MIAKKHQFHHSFLSSRLRLAGLALLIFVAGIFFASNALAANSASTAERLITIHDGAREVSVVTRGNIVGDALKQADISIGPKDIVEPMISARLVAKSYHVNIFRARPVLVVDGKIKVSVMTAEQSSKQIMKQAGLMLYDEDKTTFERVDDVLESGGAGLKLVVKRATPFNFNLYGKEFVARTQARTVGGMMKEKNIRLGENDGISMPESTAISEGMLVRIWRNGKQTITVEEAIVRPIEEIKDADKSVGTREVRTAGADGKKNVTYEIEMQNGVEISRKAIASVTTLEPVKEVVVVGAKNNYSGSLNEWLYQLRMCETHGNYQTNTGNGFYGAYQFMIPTWDNIARRTGRADLVGVLPSRASPADQDAMVIANTNATSGLSTQHPGCYRKLGLSNKPPAQ